MAKVAQTENQDLNERDGKESPGWLTASVVPSGSVVELPEQSWCHINLIEPFQFSFPFYYSTHARAHTYTHTPLLLPCPYSAVANYSDSGVSY